MSEAKQDQFVDPLPILLQFVELWRDTWQDPLDETHTYSEYYKLAEFVINANNQLQDEVAAWLVCHLASRWKSDNQDEQIEPDDLFPDWRSLQEAVFQFAEAHK